jgi:hypothetical protein
MNPNSSTEQNSYLPQHPKKSEESLVLLNLRATTAKTVRRMWRTTSYALVLLQKQKSVANPPHALSSGRFQALAPFDPLDSYHPNSSCSFKTSTAKTLFGSSRHVG